MEKQLYRITNSGDDESTIDISLSEKKFKLFKKTFKKLNKVRPLYSPKITIKLIEK